MLARISSRLFYLLRSFRCYGQLRLAKLRGAKIGQHCVLESFGCNAPKRVHLGDSCQFESGVSIKINHPFDSGPCLVIGDQVWIRRNCEFNISSKIFIGARTDVASNVTFVDVNHEFRDQISIRNQPVVASEIEIGQDCWIGTGAIILPGVRLGDGVVVGAGAVVNRSIPDHEVWAGVPAKKIKSR